MSVRHGLLALLARGPRHGYQLKQEYEDRTGTFWPLNIGQVYTTLARLERDDLIERLDIAENERTPYELTDEGRAELARWIEEPLHAAASRDELVTKVLMALDVPGVRIRDVIQNHRRALVEELQSYTRLKADADPARDLTWLMTVDALVLRVEALVHWLDQCEGRLARAGSRPGPRPTRATRTRREVRR